MPRTGTMVFCCNNVRKRGAEDDLGTDSYDLRETLAVSPVLPAVSSPISLAVFPADH